MFVNLYWARSGGVTTFYVGMRLVRLRHGEALGTFLSAAHNGLELPFTASAENVGVSSLRTFMPDAASYNADYVEGADRSFVVQRKKV